MCYCVRPAHRTPLGSASWAGREDRQGVVYLSVPWLRRYGVRDRGAGISREDTGLASSETSGELQALSEPQFLHLRGKVRATHLSQPQ